MRPALLAVLALTVAACAPSNNNSAGMNTNTTAVNAAKPVNPDTMVTDVTKGVYAPALGIDFTKMTRHATGLYYQDTKVGTGLTVGGGVTVEVRYTGTLPNGTVFDASSRHGNAPFSVTIGQHQVIWGWEVALAGMKVGGKRRVVIPTEMGYGPLAQGVIPANSTLVFDIELLKATEPKFK